MPKVENAIILAAGRGSRMKDLTKNIPKPLLPIGNTTFIENIIKKLKEKEIVNIFVVTGYKSDKFSFLEKQVTLIKNNNWNKGNNITSIKSVIDHIGNSLIINGDIIMKNNVFKAEYPNSLTYVEKNKNIDEWLVKTKNKQVVHFDKKGLGKKGFYQREIIFITKELSKLIKKNIDSFDLNEYQEFLMINTANEYNVPFTTYEVIKNTIFDVDTKEEYTNFINSK